MTKTVKVSVALHTQLPDEEGNQRQFECEYMFYNRQHVKLEIHDDGHAEFSCDHLAFPASGEAISHEGSPWIASHFSIGVAVAPGGMGGSIIIAGPLKEPILIRKGVAFSIDCSGAIHAEWLDKMRSEGKFFDHVEPDYARGLNIPD